MLTNQKFWLGIALSLCFFQAQAQDYITTRNAPKKAKEAFVEANNHLALNDYANATKGLQKVLKKYPNFINAQLVLGDTYRRQKQYDKAKIHFQKAIDLDPDYEPKIYYILGGIAMDSKEYETAEKQFEKFLTYEKINDKLRRKAEKYKGDVIFRPKALANPVPFTPKNMGDQINSTGRDYFPSITADEGLFVYTRQMDPSRAGQEDLYLSQKKDGVWQKSVPLPINTKENEAAQSISADGKLLVFTVCNRREDFGSCDLYFSENINGTWTLPKNLGSSINSGSWESQPSVAPNSDAIYYTRGGTRGQGHKDLMVSHKQADGTWGKAERIRSLNTPFDESAPCIHPDGKTLYFSSNGYPGMGGLDLFMTQLQADGTWGEPINLGYPINTEKAEEALSVNLNGNVAYLASDREGGLGSLDIYTFEMPEKMRPKPVTYVKAIVYDANTKRRLNASTKLNDIEQGKTILDRKTGQKGEFLVCLPTGVDYALYVEKEGYVFHSENFALKDLAKLDKPYVLEIPLIPIKKKTEKPDPKKEEVIILKNVFFSTNSAKLKDISKVELNKLRDLLNSNPEMRIELRGHTDNVGEEADNQTLSERRSAAVKAYLEDQGIEADRVETKGFGESKPIADNDTKEGRAQNRRTEFVILQ